MATHSSILAWKIPWTEEPGRLQSMGLQSDTTEATEQHALTVVFKVLYCKIKNVFFIICIFYVCIICVKSIIHLFQHSTI